MKTTLIFVFVFSAIRGCYSTPACGSQGPVVGACTATQWTSDWSTLHRYIESPDNEKKIGINCFAEQFTISTTTTSAVLPTEITKTTGSNPTSTPKSLQKTTIETMGTNPTSTSMSLQTTTNETTDTHPTTSSKTQINAHGQDSENLIGPVVGGGFVVLVSITAVAIYCIRKRKHGNNPNVTRSYENENVNLSESPTPQRTYEYIQQPSYQATASLTDNIATITYEGITRHALNEHLYLGISEDRTTGTSKNHIADDDYANL